MITKKQIFDDFTKALRDKDELRKAVLSDIKAEILVKEKSAAFVKTAADQSGEVDETALRDIIKSMVKRRKDSIAAYQAGNRTDLASQEKAELEVLVEYLPEQISEEKIKEVVGRIISGQGFGVADFGKAMRAAMSELKGQADGALVSKILKDKLT